MGYPLGYLNLLLQGRGLIRAERPDVIVEDINKLPLFLSSVSRIPFGVVVPHLFGGTAFEEAPWWMATIVWLVGCAGWAVQVLWRL